jgi:hypothetical protein
MFLFQALSYRRFQRGFDRVSLHRLTLPPPAAPPPPRFSFSDRPLEERVAEPPPREAPRDLAPLTCWSVKAPPPDTVGVQPSMPSKQGLTLVHCSAQLERFAWNRGCA